MTMVNFEIRNIYTVDNEMIMLKKKTHTWTQLTQCTLVLYIQGLNKTTIKINYLHFAVHLIRETTPGIYKAQILEQPTAHSCEVN